MSYEWSSAQFHAQPKPSPKRPNCRAERFIQLLPNVMLRPYVSHYTIMSVSSADPIEDLILCPLPQLDFITSGSWSIGNQRHIQGAILRGPQSRAEVVKTSGSETLSVTLTPLGLQMLGSQCAETLADRIASGASLFGQDFGRLLATLRTAPSPEAKADIVDSYFARLLQQKEIAPNPIMTTLERWIADPDAVSVETMCARLGISHSKLGRLCRRYFGFTPKFLLRRARFLRTLDQINLQPYREWPTFLDSRYVDQSHFIRDFHAFMGMTPSSYLGRSRPIALAQLHEQQLLDCFSEQRMAA
jgi:AraC-like DNA-binding protein